MHNKYIRFLKVNLNIRKETLTLTVIIYHHQLLYIFQALSGGMGTLAVNYAFFNPPKFLEIGEISLSIKVVPTNSAQVSNDGVCDEFSSKATNQGTLIESKK